VRGRASLESYAQQTLRPLTLILSREGRGNF
jgi:hypothetical protein